MSVLLVGYASAEAISLPVLVQKRDDDVGDTGSHATPREVVASGRSGKFGRWELVVSIGKNGELSAVVYGYSKRPARRPRSPRDAGMKPSGTKWRFWQRQRDLALRPRPRTVQAVADTGGKWKQTDHTRQD
jgi:hypothetical protein